MPYLRGLDGMRALAVVAVMVYHANSSWLHGGFLGVEVFFVISGYLITLLLVAEHERSGSLRLRQFWLRRARRLLPALFTMMLLVMVGTALFTRAQLGKLRGDIIAGLLYVSNWYQIWTGAGYTATNDFAPLRHLWSLAVEEQFYMIWPPVMLLILRGGRDRLPRIGAWLFAIAIAIAVGTALLYNPGVIGSCASTPGQYFKVGGRCILRSDALYLSTVTRAGGVLMGAGFAMWWRPFAVMRSPLRNRAPLLDIVALGGIAGLALLMWQLHVTFEGPDGLQGDEWLFRGGFLMTGLVSLAVISAVTHMRSITGKVLGNPLLNWIGLRSYGLYLYHWPIYQAIRKEAGVGLTLPKFAIAMAITLAITEVSYRLIETPIRTGKLRDWMNQNLRGRPTPQAAARRRRALAGGVLAMALPVFAGISLAFAPLRQGDVARSLDAGAGSVTDVLDELPLTSDVPTTADRDPATAGNPAATGITLPSATTIPETTDPNATTSPTGTSLPAGIAPVTQAPAAASSPDAIDVLAIGDSVMQGAAPALVSKGATVDAVQNRQGSEGADILEMLAAASQLPNVLVIHLGTNGPVTQATYDRMIAAAASVPFILVMTVRADRQWTADNNQRIRDLEVRYPGQVHLLDWATVSEQCLDNCFYTDNIHLRPTGMQFYADQIWNSIGRA